MSEFTWTPFVGTTQPSSSQLRSTFEAAAALVNGGLDEVANIHPDSGVALAQLAEPNALMVWTMAPYTGGESAGTTLRFTLPVWQEMRLLGASLFRRNATASGNVSCSASLDLLATGAAGSVVRGLWADTFDDAAAVKLEHWSFLKAGGDAVLPARSFARATLTMVTDNIDCLRLQLYFARRLVGIR